MKKFYLFAAIAALFAVSCTTDMTKDVECLPIGENQIFVSFEEQNDTRIQLNEECKTVWTKGDLISVFEKNRANACWRYIGATGKRNGAFIPKSSASSTQSLDKVVVVYPYNESYTISVDKRIVTTLPAEQLYHTGSYSVGDNLMVSQSDDRNFVLKSVCGWLKFQFVGTGVITKIEFSGNNYEQIAGKVRVDCTDASLALIEDMLEDPTTDDGEVGGTLIDPEDYVTTVALNCGEEGVALNSDTVTDFYLILPPQTFESGITVKVTCADGTVVEKSTTSPLTISRNAIQPMTALTINGKPATPASNEIWYTATEKVVKDNWTVDTFGANITDHTFDTTTGKGIITFDGEVTKIGDSAFQGCSSLTNITIPDSVTEIENSAFYYCLNLTSITIPDSVTKIGAFAFEYCYDLTSITIPDSVTEIGWYAFSCCDSLTSVFCERTTPPTANFEGYSSWKAFINNAADRKIYVPAESVDAYKSADGWKEYADAIVGYNF